MKHSRLQKGLAMLLALVLCLGTVPAFAAEGFYEEALYGEPAFEEFVYEVSDFEEPDYVEPDFEEPAAEEPATELPEESGLVAVRFLPEPAEAEITVYDPAVTGEFGELLPLAPDADGIYWLMPGAYLLDAVCEGYESLFAIPLTVEDEDIEVPVTLTAVPAEEPAEEPADGEPLVEELIVEEVAAEPADAEPVAEEVAEEAIVEEVLVVEEPAEEEPDKEAAEENAADAFAIVTEPASQAVEPDGTAVFTVEAKGSELTYQWQYKSGDTWKDISANSACKGAATATLTVPAKGHANMEFRCVINGSGGTLISETAQLTVSAERAVAKPRITKQPASATVSSSGTASFTVSASGSGIKYQWQYKSGSTWKNVTSSGTCKGATTATLKVPAKGHSGMQFRCAVKNSAGTVYSNTVKLTVKASTGGKPSFTTQPKDVTVSASGTATFTVRVSGSVQKYQWQYLSKGKWVSIGAGSCKGYNTATLKVPAKGHANMRFRCVVRNSNGVSYSSAAMLLISGARRYRALVVGNENYRDGRLPGCNNDMTVMASMLSGLTNRFSCRKLPDASASQIRSNIRSAFSGATNNDVSLFYYAGHGVQSSYASNLGALVGVDESTLTIRDLAAELSNIPGRVIVILDSCHSGAAIQSNGEVTGEVTDAGLEAFNQEVIDVFAEFDTVLDDGEYVPNMGELAKSKFVVLTAASAYQSSSSASYQGTPFGIFTFALSYCCGYDYFERKFYPEMPADTDNDWQLTVYEAYSTARSIASQLNSSQTAQGYATNASEMLFSRK